ncbi:MAG: cobaltochelatase subunit CobN [Gammaproteobacteria bacterium]|nr:cobaltochelatase subunit CobN [Gammaproteobacteria bacterium]
MPTEFPHVVGINLQGLENESQITALLTHELAAADIIVARVLGRLGNVPGFAELVRQARSRGKHLIVVSGTGEPDPELGAASTVPPNVMHETLTYFQAGGSMNLAQLLRYLSDHLLFTGFGFDPPVPLPEHGIYHPDLADGADIADWLALRDPKRPSAGIVFYRAHWMSGNTRFIDALVRALEHRGLNVLPVFTASLRAGGGKQLPTSLRYFSDGTNTHVDVLINTTSFAMGEITPGGPTPAGWSVAVLERLDVPVLQAITSGMTRGQWEQSTRGLNPLDAAMNVVLPEFDGRIITVPISFKERQPGMPNELFEYEPLPDRIERTAGIAARLARLKHLPNRDKRIAFVFTNSNSKASQIGNAVGLDAPASLMRLLQAMRDAGYQIGDLPVTSDVLIHELIDRCAYDNTYLTAEQLNRAAGRVPTAQYNAWFAELPPAVREKMENQWGTAPGTAYFHDGHLALAGLELGNAFVALQPPRGYGMDPDAIYHQPDLPPPHHYYALYRWLRDEWRADAIVHVGKHGTLEWLPGKGVGLSQNCAPDGLLGDMPLFYPFIINDPGEGSQAKRRGHAVVIDHLTPPMTTAGTYGALAELTQLVDEYYQVEVLDPTKLPLLQQRIWELVKQTNLDSDLQARLLHHHHDHDHPHDHDHDGHHHAHDHHHHHPHTPNPLASSAPKAFAAAGAMFKPLSSPPAGGFKLAAPAHGHHHHDHEHSHDHDHHHDHDGALPTVLAKMGGSDVAHLIEDLDGYLCELGAAQIRDGLHTLGQAPQNEQLVDMLVSLTRLPNQDVPGLQAEVARLFGLAIEDLVDNKGQRFETPPLMLAQQSGKNIVTRADALEAIDELCRRLFAALQTRGYAEPHIDDALNEVFSLPLRGRVGVGVGLGDATTKPTPLLSSPLKGEEPFDEVRRVLDFACRQLVPNLNRASDEIDNLLHGLNGGYVPAGPSGSPTRGMAHILPTGRNFYSVDPRSVPSQSAWHVGQQLAHEVLTRHLRETNEYPESVAISIWGTSAMRTHGDDVAQILALLGVRPVWRPQNRQLAGIEVVPLAELKRPRIDVTTRISGFFRDAFPQLIELIDDAVNAVIALDEPPTQNFVRKHYLAELGEWVGKGLNNDDAERRSRLRIFGSKPGSYGAGILPLIQEKNWQTDADFAEAYINWGGYAYARGEHGSDEREAFRERLAGVQVALHNQDNREHDIFDSDDYLQYHGGLIGTIRAITGKQPKHYFGDSHDPARAQVRDLKEETLRVFRARVVNPKWLASIQRHGYKGGLELTATVDYLFGYDATAQVMDDWMYEQVAQTYAFDTEMQRFLQESNPWALNAITERLLEAAQRKMWGEPQADTLAALQSLYLRSETWLEARGETPRGA